MYRKLLHAQIHRATVTAADLTYAGSLTVDSVLVDGHNRIREIRHRSHK